MIKNVIREERREKKGVRYRAVWSTHENGRWFAALRIYSTARRFSFSPYLVTMMRFDSIVERQEERNEFHHDAGAFRWWSIIGHSSLIELVFSWWLFSTLRVSVCKLTIRMLLLLPLIFSNLFLRSTVRLAERNDSKSPLAHLIFFLFIFQVCTPSGNFDHWWKGW